VSAKVPRWWTVTPAQTHYVGLHVRHGESLLAESAVDPERRKQVLEILRGQAAPARVYTARLMLESGNVQGALERITPSELFYLAKEAVGRNPQDEGGLAASIRRLRETGGEEVSDAAISRAFGTPKPTLTRSYNSELLFLRTYPTLMGFSSRILAESWESSNLFFAALADEAHVQPEELNVLIPEWTKRTVENIFATHLEDWPALLRSLRKVGQDVRTAYQPRLDAGQQASLR
jgi:hypothetical protein